MSTVIAIDGPAASGKSTVARHIAEHLGWAFINTGAMYRSVTWKFIEEGIAMEAMAIAARMQTLQVEARVDAKRLWLRLDGIDPLPHVRDAKVNQFVSIVAAVPEVRKVLVAAQRQLAKDHPVVMEGRDMGSVVFPETPYKFYIDAHEEVRSQRREAQGESDSIKKRDQIDQSRKAAPLQVAPGAIRIDTTHLTIEQAVLTVEEWLGALRAGA